MISWECFSSINLDARGLQLKFEDLCRQIFVNENISENTQFRYLHANPNNFGLETEPIYDENLQRWIGFQAKFFENRVDYSKIKDSADKIIKYYTGKEGIVNHVFLYCNKPISVAAERYKDIVRILQENGISLELVTDSAILDLVRGKYPYLGRYYFGNHTIEPEWLIHHNETMFDLLGERFNRQFHVDTEASGKLSLFVHDHQAALNLNCKKSKLLEQIEHFYTTEVKRREYLAALKQAVLSLNDVDVETLFNSLQWKDSVLEQIQSYITEFVSEIEQLKQEIESDRKGHNENRSNLQYQVSHNIISEIEELNELIAMPDLLWVDKIDELLLRSQVLLVAGKAGTGKSQLLAHESQILIDEERDNLLLVSNIYYSNETIREQIMSNLGLDYTVENLIDILEVLGEKENRIIPIFIDALNETWHYKLWKSDLPSIIKKIEHSPMVKLILSYRIEYEQVIIPKSIMEQKKEGNISYIYQNGFQDNSFEAIGAFLNQYKIPFSPIEYFGYEMTNPLFLTLYCKTYNGEETSLPTLYERLIDAVNTKIVNSYLSVSQLSSYSEKINILRPLIMEIASFLVLNNQRFISRESLVQLNYWSEYNLTAPQLIYILENENILYRNTDNENERFYFAYDQMNDYYCAKVILQTEYKKEALRKYLSEIVLGMIDGEITNYRNIELFVNCCCIYAEKYNEECIDIIDSLQDNEIKRWVFKSYIESLQWRHKIHLSFDQFIHLLNTYHCEPKYLWQMLIGNSVKLTHPFNAVFLHQMLSKWDISTRDYLWTIYINDLSENDNDRIIQLITMYSQGIKLEMRSEKQVELLLTLFGWLLTSSNRWLRDYTSKAMIEILKEHFSLCHVILEKFNHVNDPYVVQRLYGVVFGACCKRMETEKSIYQALAEYVFRTVFYQEYVYSDILMRDYARLIIERFLFEFPDYVGAIDRTKITPPYSSEPIPKLEDQHYFEREYEGATRSIISSIRFDGMKTGWYGDFGRYVFQSALRNFDIDEEEILNYALYHIFHELGFSEKLFGDYDRSCGHYGRNQTVKTERIGKKYQWITMYHILARVADHCKMKCGCYPPYEQTICCDGPWDPNVRDFDPTLNPSFTRCDNAPIFDILTDFSNRCILSNRQADISTEEKQKSWVEEQGYFLQTVKRTLVLTDEIGEQWVYLTRYSDSGHENIATDKLLVWSWLHAYFITPEQLEKLNGDAENCSSVISSSIPFRHETYTLFNREYPWSTACKEFIHDAWVDCEVNTGEYEELSEETVIQDGVDINDLLREYGIIGDEDDQALFDDLEQSGFDTDGAKPLKKSIKREKKINIGKILYSTSDLKWEGVYDASIDPVVSISHPCAELIKAMHLRQMEHDGFYYDENGKLAAFDTNLTQKEYGVVVRKDILESFLSLRELMLVWFVNAEREIHKDGYMTSMWSEWGALFFYENGKIIGEVKKRNVHNSQHSLLR